VHASEREDPIAAIASLAEPIRRGLYRYVARQQRDVGRDEAARALGISRALAAFHLDKLVRQGLLETSYRRLTRRRGPGAGRPAKLYHCSSRQLDVTLPPRRYELAGRVLARALTAAASPATRRALTRVARAAGRSLGAEARRRAGRAAGADRLLANALAMLEECGYAPARGNGVVRLRNCPFDALANDCRPLVCGMNLTLLRGALAAAGARGVRAELRPEPGSCCVILKTTRHSTR
jgi:predicted ArsR family transcriptional regulator